MRRDPGTWPSGDAYDLFLDDEGKPILRECAVVYLDVLGIRNLSTAPERLEILRRLILGLDIAREEAMLEGQESWQALSWFTDNVVVAFPTLPGHIDEEPALGSALRAATYIQLRMAVEGFLVRGGVAFGEIYMAPNVAFGPALIEAVELEEHGDNPRVLLSEKAVSLQRKVMGNYATGAAPQIYEMAIDTDEAVYSCGFGQFRRSRALPRCRSDAWWKFSIPCSASDSSNIRDLAPECSSATPRRERAAASIASTCGP